MQLQGHLMVWRQTVAVQLRRHIVLDMYTQHWQMLQLWVWQAQQQRHKLVQFEGTQCKQPQVLLVLRWEPFEHTKWRLLQPWHDPQPCTLQREQQGKRLLLLCIGRVDRVLGSHSSYWQPWAKC